MTRSWGVLEMEKRGGKQAVSKSGFMCFAQSNHLELAGITTQRMALINIEIFVCLSM